MTARRGFTLAELLIAVLIFSFMIASLATIYSTANKHQFQQYRVNTVKSYASVAMKDIVNNLMAANRIDSPNLDSAGNILAFAVNVDQGTSPAYKGCYPISALAPAPAWHYFCLSGKTLYHHTGPISGGDGCSSLSPCNSCWTTGSYPIPPGGCGGGYGTTTKLSDMVIPGASGVFTRRKMDSVYEDDQVKIVLRFYWDPAATLEVGDRLKTSGRVIETTLTSNVKINRSVN